MAVLVVGSIAYDSIETKNAKVNEILGGSASYFSLSANFFTDVYLVAVVGDDFKEEHLNLFKDKNINLDGLKIENGKTFRWIGKYSDDLNEAITLDTQLNVFSEFKPKLPQNYRKIPYVFLANIDPDLQLYVLKQVEKPKFICADTMNYWIKGKFDSLKVLLKEIDALVINEGEVELMTGEKNIVKACKILKDYGPKYIIIKRGKYGVFALLKDEYFSIPALPIENVVDTTGAGDSFAGGFMGFLSEQVNIDNEALKKAISIATVMSSFCIEAFSVNKFLEINYNDILKRYNILKSMSFIPDID